MKTTLTQKLLLNKQTVAKLNSQDMNDLYGGATWTVGECWTDVPNICRTDDPRMC